MVWPGANNQLDYNTVPDIQKYYLDGSNIILLIIIIIIIIAPFLIIIIIIILLRLLFLLSFFLSVDHELVHGRSQELLDRIS